MPYIAENLRNALDGDTSSPVTPGELNYKITKICVDYIYNMGGTCYVTLNEVMGVLECAKQELYRRIAAPYEDVKCKQNGDVYHEVNSK